ncbi:MAG: hydrogenase maturation nickel metallochaperone HypA [Slackia sp.]|nr:hydrogenase maturation nickel metallochaperone HypA [Slackia sp.]
MHELGIMTGVVDSVTQAAQANGALKVLKVSLSVGRMTEAIEDALQFAFEALTDRDPLYEGAQLEIAMVEPRSRCTECGNVYEHDRFHVSCPSCGGFGELIAGKELRIDSIEVDLPDDEDAEGCADESPDVARDEAPLS